MAIHNNFFLFIIPLTPLSHLTETRKELQKICFNTLKSQNYSNWKAILIGKLSNEIVIDDHFIVIDFEGHKEEKLQVATKYILDRSINSDYIIRLDDDDIFNPTLLNSLKTIKVDLFVDKYHSFWNASSGQIAQKIVYWLPNTCIHKSGNALSVFGNFPPGDYKRFDTNPLLIQNEHNDFKFFYNQRHIIKFSSKNNPVYLRVLNPDSITSLQSSDYTTYLNNHGYWRAQNLSTFYFLKPLNFKKKFVNPIQSFVFRIKEFVYNVKAFALYYKIVIKK